MLFLLNNELKNSTLWKMQYISLDDFWWLWWHTLKGYFIGYLYKQHFHFYLVWKSSSVGKTLASRFHTQIQSLAQTKTFLLLSCIFINIILNNEIISLMSIQKSLYNCFYINIYYLWRRLQKSVQMRQTSF